MGQSVPEGLLSTFRHVHKTFYGNTCQVVVWGAHLAVER